MTPFQANLTVKEGAYLIEYAYDKGINFLDTAELYENYEYIRTALKHIKRENYVITTKTYAYTKEMAKNSLDLALKELGTDYIDMFLLHEQESIHTVRGHFEAIEYFLKEKEKGKIRSIGISTHRISGVEAAKEVKEIEVVHPIFNKYGIGIQDGNVEGMLKAIQEVHKMGKGIYAMKPLGGGHLIKEAESAFNYVKEIDSIDSIAIGMQSTDEIDANISLIENGYIPEELKCKLRTKKRRLIVAEYCIGCGNCVSSCKQDAMEIINGIATPNEKCILCGYCAKVCPEFCIKVV
jgi:predicted aldo/keto reductase-like oxidoreductase